MSKRIVFTFDDRSFKALEQLTETGDFGSYADAVRESLTITRALQKQAKQGFTEVRVYNPSDKVQRTLIVPDLISTAQPKRGKK